MEVRLGDWKDCARGVGAIVNPANSKLSNAGGMAMLIEDAAGPTFRALCEAALRGLEGGSLTRGSATLTESGALSTVLGIPWVAHCVAPHFETGSTLERSLLRCAIRRLLTLVADKGVTSVAICGVGAGVFGWPPNESTREIVLALQQWVASRHDATMRVVLYDVSESVVAGFVSALQHANDAPHAAGATCRGLQCVGVIACARVRVCVWRVACKQCTSGIACLDCGAVCRLRWQCGCCTCASNSPMAVAGGWWHVDPVRLRPEPRARGSVLS